MLIDHCGRTDFQNGNATDLYRSITEKLFVLEGDTLVYPGHDYHGKKLSSIAQERAHNSRIADGVDLQQFMQTMTDLDLRYPKFIDYAVTGNKLCGECPSDLPENMQMYCEQMTESPQG